MYKKYTKEQLDEFEEKGELYVCPHCGQEGHVDDFGETCFSCGQPLEDQEE